jgi:tetratricopeptide (TPR) repeat protein
MSRPVRSVLLGAFTAALLAAVGGAAWQHLGDHAVLAAPPPPPPEAREPMAAPPEEALPLPPEPPRLANSAEYEQCLALLREDADGARAMAETWDRAGGGDGARHCFAMALLALGQPEQAASRLESLGTRSGAGAVARAAVLGQAGQAWLMAGQPNRAYAAITMALTITPADPLLLTDRAVVAGILGRYAEAVSDLDRVLEIDGDRVEAWVFHAAAQRHLDHPQQAMTDITRALALDPDNAEALLERGILRQMAGDTAGARQDWQRVLELSPDSAAADLAQQNLALNEAGPARR